MKNNTKGFIASSVIIKIVLAIALFCGGLFVAKKLSHPNSPSRLDNQLSAEKAIAAKSGQQLAAATTKEVSLVKDQSDPAVIAARKTSARADVALASGLGALTPEQAQWVQNLIEADAAGFTASLAAKDEQISKTGDKISELEEKIASERSHSGLLEKLLIAGVIIFVFINYILPWLEKIFPPLGLFVSAIHAVANPFLASLKVKAQADISAAEAKASQLISEVGSAISDMRNKLGSAAAPAIQQLDSNLSNSNIDAVAKAASAAAADVAAKQAAAAAAVQIAAN